MPARARGGCSTGCSTKRAQEVKRRKQVEAEEHDEAC
jgi:hypothetical protein